MKLYLFDSCPYCMRVSALIGLKKINCEMVYLIPGEFPVRLKELVEHFRVPMLELPGESGNPSIMQESGDIICYLDQLDEKPLLESYEPSLSLTEWLNAISSPLDYLCYPRMLMLGLPELNSEQACIYFKKSREEHLGMTLEQAMDKTVQWTGVVEKQLASLSSVIELNDLVKEKRRLRMDDLYLFAVLRSLTMVAELKIPDHVSRYLDYLSHATGIDLYPQISANTISA